MSKPIVIVVRDPDFSNEYRVFDGEVETYDIDCGYSDLSNWSEFKEWAESHLTSAEQFRRNGHEAAAQYIEQVVANYYPEVEPGDPRESFGSMFARIRNIAL